MMPTHFIAWMNRAAVPPMTADEPLSSTVIQTPPAAWTDNADLLAVQRASAVTPTVVSIYLDRPAILAQIRPLATALIGEFGVSDAAFFDFITGRATPQARLPFELPSSMNEVESQAPDAGSDTSHPLYPRGYGRLGW